MRYISLGSVCQLANSLALMGLKKETMPFDFVASRDFSKVTNAILTDFSGYTHRQHFEIHDYQPINPGMEQVVQNYIYDVSFPHDLIAAEQLKDFDNFKSKYDRRIKRFMELTGPVLFIRYQYLNTDKTYKHAIRLVEHFKSRGIEPHLLNAKRGDVFECVWDSPDYTEFIIPERNSEGLLFDQPYAVPMWKHMFERCERNVKWK